MRSRSIACEIARLKRGFWNTSRTTGSGWVTLKSNWEATSAGLSWM